MEEYPGCEHGNYHCPICEVQLQAFLTKELREEQIRKYYGYFESSTSLTPEYDPGKSAPCLICYKPWESHTVKTISLMVPSDHRSYFYRVHKTCYESLTEIERMTYDSALIDNLLPQALDPLNEMEAE